MPPSVTKSLLSLVGITMVSTETAGDDLVVKSSNPCWGGIGSLQMVDALEKATIENFAPCLGVVDGAVDPKGLEWAIDLRDGKRVLVVRSLWGLSTPRGWPKW